MSEQQNPSVAPPQAPQMSEAQQIIMVKNQMLAHAHSVYQQLSNFVASLPINPHMKQRALDFFDDGMLRVEHAVKIAEIKLEGKPLQPADKSTVN